MAENFSDEDVDRFLSFAEYFASRPSIYKFVTDTPEFYCWYEYGSKPRSAPMTSEQLAEYLRNERGYSAEHAHEAAKVASSAAEWAWYQEQLKVRKQRAVKDGSPSPGM